MKIEQFTLYRLCVPLTTPYRLSLGAIHAFDTVIIELRDDSNRTGLGEATYLSGYTDETFDDSWLLAQRLGREFAGLAANVIQSRLEPYFESAPFTATAFNTALEMLAGNAMLAVDRP